MLVTLNEILSMADAQKCAVGAFNTPNLECITAVTRAAERLGVPVIFNHAEMHEKVAPIEIIAPAMLDAAKRAKIPICVHLDHCETLEYMEKALKLGFTGVMYDGSTLPYEENVRNTRLAVQMAKRFGNVGVEAEIGMLPSREGGEKATGPVYTDPDLAKRFCEETGIDALAPSFGTAHGIYKSKPVLDLDRVKAVAEKTGLPLVMHGGSGVSPEDYRTAIQNGIRKINYFTYGSKAAGEAVAADLKNEEVPYYHKMTMTAYDAFCKDYEHVMKVFANGAKPIA